MPRSLVARLTLINVAVLCLVLVLFAVGLDLVMAPLRLAHLDQELQANARTLAAAVATELDEGLTLPAAVEAALAELVLPGRWIAVYDPSGALAGSLWPGRAAPPLTALGGAGTTLVSPSGDLRVQLRRHVDHAGRYVVAVAASLADLERERGRLRSVLVLGIPLAMTLAAAVGWAVSGRALAPMGRMAAEAGAISARDLSARLTVEGTGEELRHLARTFNDVLARLGSALDSQRRFVADAAHQLRTPVSVIRTATQVTLGGTDRAAEEYREALATIDRSSRRLAGMVDDLLTLAASDVDRLRLSYGELYLDDLVRECVQAAAAVAAPLRVSVECRAAMEVAVTGDEERLRQLLGNLLHNAVEHTPVGGRVEARVELQGEQAVVTVTDTGRGIPAGDRDRIFERFVRLDPGGGGAGLGLPIARRIAEAHGGTLSLEASGPSGSRFVFRFPCRPPAAGSATSAAGDGR